MCQGGKRWLRFGEPHCLVVGPSCPVRSKCRGEFHDMLNRAVQHKKGAMTAAVGRREALFHTQAFLQAKPFGSRSSVLWGTSVHDNGTGC